jgi:hypothetical protein
MALVVWVVGCAGPGPTGFPAAPVSYFDDDARQPLYDTDGDGAADYGYRLDERGRVAALLFMDASAGTVVAELDLEQQRAAAEQHLLLIMDSVPHDVAADLHRHGAFRLCAPPQRVISPFPVMTDVALNEFFGLRPTPAVEAAHVKNGRRSDATKEYLDKTNSAWLAAVDYYLPYGDHAWSYLDSFAWLEHELGAIERQLAAAGPGEFVGYVVSTSGLGMWRGRTGHQQALLLVDQLCQQLTQRYRGKLHITVMSDHGHAFGPHRRMKLGDELAAAGFEGWRTPPQPASVFVPEFGLVSMAAIYGPERVALARALAGFSGVELVAYPDEGAVVVLSADGRALIERSNAGFRYRPIFGDPLALGPVLAELREAGAVREDGFVASKRLFKATVAHRYPDPVRRLWDVWHGAYRHPPDVVVSLAPGWLSGDGFMWHFIEHWATHGSLRRESSTAFVMSTYGQIPEPVAMSELRSALDALVETWQAEHAE